MFLDFRDQVGAADDQAGLRAAQQFVAAEGDEVGTGFDGVAHGGLARQSIGAQVDQRAAAQIDRKRHAPLARERGELFEFDAVREALDRVVAGVDFHQQRAARAERFLVVAQMRAVGGADLDQFRPGARHDVGNAERAADLDQFAARHDHFAARRERGEHQQHRRRIVVDDGCSLRASELAQQVVDQVVAVAARAAVEIEFEVDWARQRFGYRAHRLLGQHRAPEVGVQHGAGQVENSAQPRARPLLQHDPGALAQRGVVGHLRCGARAQCAAQCVEHRAHCRERLRAPVERAQLLAGVPGHQSFDRRHPRQRQRRIAHASSSWPVAGHRNGCGAGLR